MNAKKIIAAASLCLLPALAHADLMNISASGNHSGTVSNIACTIVSTGETTLNGYRELVVFAESTGSGNAKLRVESLDYDYTLQNTDWEDLVLDGDGLVLGDDYYDFYGDIPSYIEGVLRAPGLSSDAALPYPAYPGERICAFSNDESGSSSFTGVNISITDVTETLMSIMEAPGGDALKKAQVLDGSAARRR